MREQQAWRETEIEGDAEGAGEGDGRTDRGDGWVDRDTDDVYETERVAGQESKRAQRAALLA